MARWPTWGRSCEGGAAAKVGAGGGRDGVISGDPGPARYGAVPGQQGADEKGGGVGGGALLGCRKFWFSRKWGHRRSGCHCLGHLVAGAASCCRLAALFQSPPAFLGWLRRLYRVAPASYTPESLFHVQGDIVLDDRRVGHLGVLCQMAALTTQKQGDVISQDGWICSIPSCSF
jgi:hypothetical protein